MMYSLDTEVQWQEARYPCPECGSTKELRLYKRGNEIEEVCTACGHREFLLEYFW